MTHLLTANRYGKARVRLLRVLRGEEGDRLFDVEVDVRLTGDFAAAYVHGDNSQVLPTDTMKNTVYGLAREHPVAEVEELGLLLAEHFLAAAPAATEVTVDLSERRWRPIKSGGRAHGHAFLGSDEERRTARVVRTAETTEVRSGLSGLRVMKTARSGFTGFPRDRFTTLAETDDRLFVTLITADWRFSGAPAEAAVWGRRWAAVRECLLEAFAEHDSRSAQHTLYAMAEAVLAGCAEVEEVHLVLPNKHHLVVDCTKFGLDNPNVVFVATDEPYGVIEGTVRRG